MPESYSRPHHFNYHSATDRTEWIQAYEMLHGETKSLFYEAIRSNARYFAGIFYHAMLEDPEAAPRLSHDVINTHLNNALQNWLVKLLTPEDESNVDDIIELQRIVGRVHARINIPTHLVTRGARILKNEIAEMLRSSTLQRNALSVAQQYVDNLFELAMEKMSKAFSTDTEQRSRTDEAYRLFSLGQNMGAEREKQRASLLEWLQEVLLAMYCQDAPLRLPSIGLSEFGLWFNHKARMLFEGSIGLDKVATLMQRIDDNLLVELQIATKQHNHRRQIELIGLLQDSCSEIKFITTTLFDAASEIENGRDTLTNVLSRRFLQSVLRREINLAMIGKRDFSVLMLDIDHFKVVNDTYGHKSGDSVLQQVAELIISCCRASDFVFRYGGEEFIIVLVDVTQKQALTLAQQIRSRIEAHRFQLNDPTYIDIQVSIGVAMFDGHPDCDFIIHRADKALYDAKAQGRNRVIISDLE